MPVRTLAALWQRALAEPPSTPAFLARGVDGWAPVGWAEAGQAVDELAAGFLSLGIAKGDRVAILSRTRLEWALCDWALIAIGALPVPIYPTSSPLECAYLLGNSGARSVVCEDAEQLAKIASVRRELEALEQVVVLEGEPEDGVFPFAELRRRGRALLVEDADVLVRTRARIREDDPLTIVYTSGTTGPPKGCLLTNRNYFTMVEMVGGVEGLVGPGDRVLLHLPLAHTFARLVELLGASIGFTIAFCPEASALPDALREVRPTVLPSVPRLFERLAAAIRSGLDEQRGVRRRLASWALRVGYEASARRQSARRSPLGLAVRSAVADRLVLAAVRERLGGRVRVAISGGAPLAKEVAELLDAVGVPVLEGYGLTECTTAATLNRPGRYRFGTVGQALDGVELRIATDGEILIRGENVFAGYYRDEQETATVLDPFGWLHSGDVGSLDADGFLTITDRKKDIIVTAGGENVSPQSIETALESSRLVQQALVVGDRRPYLVALLAPDEEELRRAAATREEAEHLIERVVDEVNRGRRRDEQVRRFALVPRPFKQQESELTPTLKLRRHVCEEHFRDEIDELYAPARPRHAG